MSKTLFAIDEATKLKVYDLFGKTKEQVDEDVRIVSEWVKAQPHFPEIMDEHKIWNFLIMNKYSIEKTKQKIDMYYSIRTLMPHWFKNVNPNSENMKYYSRITMWGIHPKPLEGLYRMHFYKLTKSGAFSFLEALGQLFNIFEVRLKEDCMVGDIIIADLENVALEDIAKVTLPHIINTAQIYQKVYALRLKAAHFINSPPAASILMALIKGVVKPKIFDRIHVHKDSAILSELLSEEMLPTDYGGKGPSLDEMHELLNFKFIEYTNRFNELDNLKVDESLRPEKLQNDEHLGFYGNFKKLTVD